jgi:hypothetical protein
MGGRRGLSAKEGSINIKTNRTTKGSDQCQVGEDNRNELPGILVAVSLTILIDNDSTMGDIQTIFGR